MITYGQNIYVDDSTSIDKFFEFILKDNNFKLNSDKYFISYNIKNIDSSCFQICNSCCREDYLKSKSDYIESNDTNCCNQIKQREIYSIKNKLNYFSKQINLSKYYKNPTKNNDISIHWTFYYPLINSNKSEIIIYIVKDDQIGTTRGFYRYINNKGNWIKTETICEKWTNIF